MRSVPRAGALLLAAALLAACASQPPSADPTASCAVPPAPEVAREAFDRLADGATGDLVAQAREGTTTAYLFRFDRPAQPGESVTVLLTDGCGGGIFSRDRLLRDDVAATVVRIGAGSAGADGAMLGQPGYLVGMVRDRRVRAIEMYWPADGTAPGADPGRWTMPVASGAFLNAVPDTVPPDVVAGYRAIDADGAVLAELGSP